MPDTLVPAQRTALQAQDVYAALARAWLTVLGAPPTRASLLVLLAQWSLETGAGKACLNYNLGGIKHVPGDGRQFTIYTTTEYIGGERHLLEQSFRAYNSLNEAACDYLLELRHRFTSAWPAVEAGDPGDFAHRLKLRHYYTEPEDSYTAGLRSRYADLNKLIPPPPDTDPGTPTALASGRPAYVAPEPEMTSPGSLPPPDDEPA